MVIIIIDYGNRIRWLLHRMGRADQKEAALGWNCWRTIFLSDQYGPEYFPVISIVFLLSSVWYFPVISSVVPCDQHSILWSAWTRGESKVVFYNSRHSLIVTSERSGNRLRSKPVFARSCCSDHQIRWCRFPLQVDNIGWGGGDIDSPLKWIHHDLCRCWYQTLYSFKSILPPSLKTHPDLN